MRKYIDCVRVTDVALAYTIVEALEKNEDYSVDFFENTGRDPMKVSNDVRREIELRVYRNEKLIPAPTMGFSEEG